MIPFSTRYTASMAVICALGLAPVAIHSYGDLRIEDCAQPDQLASRYDWERLPEVRRERLRVLLGAFSAREGSIEGEAGEPKLEFSIVRSWDPKRLYYRPDHEIVESFDPTGRELERLESGADTLPIHVPIYPENAAIRAAYLLVYDGAPMADPVLEQVARSPRMMLRGARPITLYFARIQRASAPDEARRRVRAWLAEAWQRHRSVCEPSEDRRIDGRRHPRAAAPLPAEENPADRTSSAWFSRDSSWLRDLRTALSPIDVSATSLDVRNAPDRSSWCNRAEFESLVPRRATRSRN